MVVQLSLDLTTWPPADKITSGADTGSSGPGVTITDEDATDLVQVVIPSATPKRFARLCVSQQ